MFPPFIRGTVAVTLISAVSPLYGMEPPATIALPSTPLSYPMLEEIEQGQSDGVVQPSVQLQNCSPHRARATWWNTSAKPKLQYSHWGYPEHFVARPFGSYARGAFHNQIANGLAAQMTLYHVDFLNPEGDLGPTLSKRGREQLLTIVELTPYTLCPIVIERSRDSVGDQARRAAVLTALAELGIPLPDERVIVARPAPRAMDAIEADLLYRNLIRGSGSILPESSQGLSQPVSVVPVSVQPTSPAGR